MLNLAIFASGSGSNAENIIKYFDTNPHIRVKLIVSNNKDAYVHKRAELLNIESVYFRKSDFLSADPVINLLMIKGIDVIILAGFLLKIPDAIIDQYPNRIINIHPSLLPKYGGKGMYGDNVHRAVYDSKDTQTGITVHYVNEDYDKGDILFQAKCNIGPTDTVEQIANKVHELEYEYFPRVIDSVLQEILKQN